LDSGTFYFRYGGKTASHDLYPDTMLIVYISAERYLLCVMFTLACVAYRAAFSELFALPEAARTETRRSGAVPRRVSAGRPVNVLPINGEESD